eukprot:maker-scaffold54_size448012-snap-gene-3.2 protein:Tk00997 transcript:maker-scaffold54_size448012-snap-gene-3.2-mRNA-1 annotation:"cytochrome c oxidase subunit i"
MEAVAQAGAQVVGQEHDHEHHEESFIRKYIFSEDHKTIAKQYLISGIFWAVIGGLMSVVFRLQLGFPDMDMAFLKPILGQWISIASDGSGSLDPNFYLALVTMHGTIMVFFVLTAGLSGTFSNFLIPLQIGARDMASGFMNMLSYWIFFLSAGLSGTFSNFLIPLQIGARDMASGFMNMLSYWIFFLSGLLMFWSLFIATGPAGGGWVIYPPLSALAEANPGSGTVLLSAALLLIFDRSFGTSFYLSDIYINGQALPNQGGSPILFQHLFWFLGHPEVYIIILPALGLTSEIIATNSRKPIFGYKAMIFSMAGIMFLAFIVWAHHMFMTGMNPFLGSVFMLLTLIIAVPSAVKAFNYIATLWKGNIIFTPAMLFAIGLVSFFVSGGLTGIILGNSALDIQLHDTYFVVAHFHIVMGAAAIFGMLAGVYHWFPKMFGRMLNKNMGYAHFWLTFISSYLVFFPMHYIGIAGFPRRYYQWSGFETFNSYMDLNAFITVAAIISVFAQLIFIGNFIYSIFWGKKATANPWRSNTLEWTTPINPGHGNWVGEIPT